MMKDGTTVTMMTDMNRVGQTKMKIETSPGTDTEVRQNSLQVIQEVETGTISPKPMTTGVRDMTEIMESLAGIVPNSIRNKIETTTVEDRTTVPKNIVITVKAITIIAI